MCTIRDVVAHMEMSYMRNLSYTPPPHLCSQEMAFACLFSFTVYSQKYI